MKQKCGSFLFGLLVLVVFQLVGIQPAACWETVIGDTQPYYAGYYTGFASSYGHGAFMEDDGTIHLAMIENYELFHYLSNDDGQTWTSEQVVTGHEGLMNIATITVDRDGHVFIGYNIHYAFNYGNPTGVVFGYEFYYDLYCVNNESGSWVVDTLYAPARAPFADNWGAQPTAMIVDADNNVRLFANRGGWNTTGGTAWEWVYDNATDTWGPQVTVIEITDASMDRFIHTYYQALVDSAGTITLFMQRQDDGSGLGSGQIFAMQNSGAGWSAPIVIDTGFFRTYGSHFSFGAAIDQDDHIHLIYEKRNPAYQPEFYHSIDFGTPTSFNTCSAHEQVYSIRLHSDAEGNLTALTRSSVRGVTLLGRKNGGNWSTPYKLPTKGLEGTGFYQSVVRTHTHDGVFSNFRMLHIGPWADGPTGGTEPYDPHTAYWYDSSSTVALDMGCSPTSGTLPFDSIFSVGLTNVYLEKFRRIAVRVDLTLGGGGTISNFRSGYTNIGPSATYSANWTQNFPELGSVVGDNTFLITAEDITPAPYNQPPHPAAGDTYTDSCTVTATALE